MGTRRARTPPGRQARPGPPAARRSTRRRCAAATYEAPWGGSLRLLLRAGLALELLEEQLLVLVVLVPLVRAVVDSKPGQLRLDVVHEPRKELLRVVAERVDVGREVLVHLL